MAKASNSGNGAVTILPDPAVPEAKPGTYAPMTAPDRVTETAKLVAESVRAAINGTVQSIQKLLDEAQADLNAVVREANGFCEDLSRIGGEHADRIEKSMLEIRGISQRVIDERKRYADANPTTTPAKPDPRAVEIGEKVAAGEWLSEKQGA